MYYTPEYVADYDVHVCHKERFRFPRLVVNKVCPERRNGGQALVVHTHMRTAVSGVYLDNPGAAGKLLQPMRETPFSQASCGLDYCTYPCFCLQYSKICLQL